MKTIWTQCDFDGMCWHDNHVHGFSLAEGKHGSGTLTFDIDYILEWIKGESDGMTFRIAPADLAFHEVTNLVFQLDYASSTAALTPFSLQTITRTEVQRERYLATVWCLELNWPAGNISFESTGYVQTLRESPVISEQQFLKSQERAGDR